MELINIGSRKYREFMSVDEFYDYLVNDCCFPSGEAKEIVIKKYKSQFNQESKGFIEFCKGI